MNSSLLVRFCSSKSCKTHHYLQDLEEQKRTKYKTHHYFHQRPSAAQSSAACSSPPRSPVSSNGTVLFTRSD